MEDPGTDVLLEKIDKLLDVPYTRLEKLQSLYASLEKAPPLPHGTPAELPLPSIRIRLQIYHYCIPRKQVIEVSSPRFHTAWPFVDRTLDFDAPVVSMTVDPNFNAESMRIYLECSRQMLSVVKQLQMFKSLDTTWYNSAVLVMAITTTLFAQWEKRNETSAGDLAALRVEMDQWLNIISDVGALLGSGSRLREAVRVVTDGTLGLLSRSLQSKNAAFASQAGGENVSAKSPHRRTPSNSTSNTNGFGRQNFNSSFSDANQTSTCTAPNYLSSDNQLTHQSTRYPAATQYYPDPPATSSSVQYSPQDSHSYSTYSDSNTMADSVEAPLLAAFAAQASQVAPNN